MLAATHNPLTRVVKRILDFFRVFVFVVLIAAPVVVIVMTIGQSSQPESWGIDIGVFSRFVIDLSAFAGGVAESTGVREPIISGLSVINLDTSSLYAFYVFVAISEIGGIIVLYCVIQFRTLFASLVGGTPFTSENSGRIRKVGFAVIIGAIVSPLMQYFGGRAMLAEYSLNVPGIQLSPAFELPIAGIFIGLVLIVLSGVLNEAAGIYKTQQLTI